MDFDVIIIGGGASGFFSALNCAQLQPNLKIAILERGADVLEKVRISGGGRCNVTHAVFEPKPLTGYYPRGRQELLGPFHSFMTGDTMQWFEDLGVALKIEEDGRVFPVSDSSQSIINCFTEQAEKYDITLFKKTSATKFETQELGWRVFSKNQKFDSQYLIIASGSNPKILQMLKAMNLNIVPQVPSLFTFNITDDRIKDLAGLSSNAVVSLLDMEDNPIRLNKSGAFAGEAQGQVLVTHWGLSGPGILKLSAWGARELKALNYQFKIQINWLPDLSSDEISKQLNLLRFDLAKQHVSTYAPFDIPKRLWQRLVMASGIVSGKKWADISAAEITALTHELNRGVFHVSGKSTFKEEFVTAGGVDLKEIDFKSFMSKKYENLYLVGEVLNIDAITGGFNFQNAWTGGYIAARDISRKTSEMSSS
ncbi:MULTISPECIES: NAD(P)/FAD-dependent oxidoreductase [unclassified Leeuwenhoekiella]|uniref:NAD(P)/FAD-dependent oxidoreductase n=1 Tax=unclassified Leeuwenhoekiella TaxID=2615029 RepID=UPI000C3BC7B3|nr:MULTISPECIES: NAD(P)/FAD-dependent oxidoreductase [unclassified Leeuwenhoekiella]MBA80490.1 aminoacetone oxidase family FAD-binding enzyme [Leeuwenhoekiella sp.]|tara:strand:- start:79635 stop:80906 length:1272 start_codon:yes stop_codon:yes gene_type:complete